MNDNIGEKIYEKRRELNLTQEQLANKIQVSRQTISNWETGTTFPDSVSLKRLETILNIKQKPDSKQRLKKQYIIILSILLLLILTVICTILLIQHFILSKYYIYNISTDNSVISIGDSIYIKSFTKNYLSINNISINLNGEQIYDYKIRMYELNNDVEKNIFNSINKSSFIIEEDANSIEYFDDDFNINNVYLEIVFNYNGEEQIVKTKLDFTLNFSYKYKSNVSSNPATITNVTKEIDKNILYDNGYYSEDNINFFKTVDNYEYLYSLESQSLLITLTDDVQKIRMFWITEYDIINITRYDKLNQLYVLNLNYDIEDNSVSCLTSTCNDYQKYIDLSINEINNIT